MRYARWGGLGGLVIAMAAATAAEPAGGVSVKVLTYDQLGRMVRGLRGKVVVVDFWANY
jgi:hypothetical protein